MIISNPVASAVEAFAFKNADESRASTVSTTADTDLTDMTLEAGNWTGYFSLLVETAAAQGFRWQMRNVGGAWASVQSGLYVGHNSPTGILSDADINTHIQTHLFSTGMVGTLAWVQHWFGLEVFTQLDVELRWAQAVSNVANTTVKRGSHAYFRKLS